MPRSGISQSGDVNTSRKRKAEDTIAAPEFEFTPAKKRASSGRAATASSARVAAKAANKPARGRPKGIATVVRDTSCYAALILSSVSGLTMGRSKTSTRPSRVRTQSSTVSSTKNPLYSSPTQWQLDSWLANVL